MQKKMLSLLLSLVFAVSCGLVSFADGSAELPPVRCVGVGDKAVITGSLDNAADDLGFITVFEGSSWESLRETEDYDMLKYVGEAAVDENGRFDITVGIVTSGEYRYEIKGFKKSDISASGKFYYINDSERSQASSEMKSIPLSDKAAATTMIARKVSQYKNAFGLFDGLYSEEALDGACEIIYNSIKDIKNEDVSLCVNKAFTAALLNSGKISDVGDYEFSLGLEASGLEKYYKKSESLTKKLAAEKYTSTQQFDKN